MPKVSADAFWNDTRVRDLGDLFETFFENRSRARTARQIHKNTQSKRALQGFIRTFQQAFEAGLPLDRRPRLMASEYGELLKLIENHAFPRLIVNLQSKFNYSYAKLEELIKDHRAHKELTRGATERAEVAVPQTGEALNIVKSMIDSNSEAIRKAEDWLFRNTHPNDHGRKVRFFDTMRYSKIVGEIARSLTEVWSPGLDRDGLSIPTVYFRNYYRNRNTGAQRVSSGFVVLIDTLLYLVGTIRVDNNNASPIKGFKIMTMNFSNPTQKILYGLVSSLTPESEPVCGRIAMVGIDSPKDLESFKTGRYDEVALRRPDNEITKPHYLEAAKTFRQVQGKIQNEIKFKLMDKLYFKGRVTPCSQDKMRNETESLCTYEQNGEQHPAFTLGTPTANGQNTFNPADHVHYPFNQALLPPTL